MSEDAFIRVICRHEMKTVRRPSDRDVNWILEPGHAADTGLGRSSHCYMYNNTFNYCG